MLNSIITNFICSTVLAILLLLSLPYTLHTCTLTNAIGWWLCACLDMIVAYGDEREKEKHRESESNSEKRRIVEATKCNFYATFHA